MIRSFVIYAFDELRLAPGVSVKCIRPDEIHLAQDAIYIIEAVITKLSDSSAYIRLVGVRGGWESTRFEPWH